MRYLIFFFLCFFTQITFAQLKTEKNPFFTQPEKSDWVKVESIDWGKVSVFSKPLPQKEIDTLCPKFPLQISENKKTNGCAIVYFISQRCYYFYPEKDKGWKIKDELKHLCAGYDRTSKPYGLKKSWDAANKPLVPKIWELTRLMYTDEAAREFVLKDAMAIEYKDTKSMEWPSTMEEAQEKQWNYDRNWVGSLNLSQ